jgi:PAS domain-containing protein
VRHLAISEFLGNQLNARRFTAGADKLFKLIPGDVGRPLSDLVNDLLYPEMTDEAREVLRTLVFSEKQVVTTDGRWYLVRIMPYRTTEDVIVGVVITFSDITAPKKLEAELREEIAKLKGGLNAEG